MCGFVAIYAYGADAPPVARQEVLAVRDAMTARGPDDAGLWLAADGRIGLGHRRLAIIDLGASGAQPMSLPPEIAAGGPDDGRLRIVFNGEIYNYRALRATLEQHGHRFRSESDTEVLLHLYRRHGPEMVHQLRGMYAFALWDEARGGLLLARDPFGIKPLYYADDGQTVRVASQVKALCAGGQSGHGLAPAGAVGFFLWGYVPEPHTLYADIHALPAGSCIWIDRHGVGSPRPFFAVREALAVAEDEADQLTPDEQQARLGAALRDTVAHHLVADVPVGVFLSAGLDSTTLAVLAAAQHGGQNGHRSSRSPAGFGGDLRTATLGFEEYRGTAADEVPLAEATAAACGIEHQTCWVRGSDFRADLPALLAAMDQPSIDGVNAYFVSKAVAQAGLKVALSGLGGDELFGSYPSYRQIPRLVRTLAPFAAWPNLGRTFRRVAAPLLQRYTSPKYAGLFEYGTTVGDAYLLRRGLFMPWELPQLLDPELIRQGWAELEPRLRLREDSRGLRRSFAQVAALELAWYMRGQLLRDADWAGMAHSLEIRVPLVDVELFRAVAPLVTGSRPPRKRAMLDVALDVAGAPGLPEAVRRRPKSGFNVPVRDWLHRRPEAPDPQIADHQPEAAPARRLRDWARYVFADLGPVAAG